MKQLPVIGCSLSADGLAAQVGRAQALRSSVEHVEASPRELDVRFTHAVDERVVEELVATERGCCPFFAIDWDRERLRLHITVDDPAREPALAEVAQFFR